MAARSEMGNFESAGRRRSEAGQTAAPTSTPHTQRARASLLRRTTQPHHHVEVPSNSQTRRVLVPPGYTSRPGATHSTPVSTSGPATAGSRDSVPDPRAGGVAPASEDHRDACTPTADTRATADSPERAADSTCSSPLIGPRNNTGWFDEGSEPLPPGAADLLDHGGSTAVSRQTSSTAEQALEQALCERQSHSIARVRDWLGSVNPVAGTA